MRLFPFVVSLWGAAFTSALSLRASPHRRELLAYDFNEDGVEDGEDLIFVFRAIDDPLGEISPGDPLADINADGVVDLHDVVSLMVYLTETYGPAAISPLTPNDFNDLSTFNWDQVPLDDERRRLAIDGDGFSPILSWNLNYRYLEESEQCGKDEVGKHKKGRGNRPAIQWDNGYAYNPNAKATLKDYRNWVIYKALLVGAQAAGHLPDGTRAYSHYRGNTGGNLIVNYAKACRDDPFIKAGVDKEIAAVREAVREMHDGEEQSFSFHSTDSELVNSATENWQKALGGHRIWSTGTVAYDKDACKLTVELTIHMEDFYNFNRGALDIATGLPDNDNGRFEVLGWAKSFFSRGTKKRTLVIDLKKAEDGDAGTGNGEDEEKCRRCRRCSCRPDPGMSGDPHLKNWKGEYFDYMGECDLRLFHVPNFDHSGSNLTVHVRTTIQDSYSFIESAAIGIGDDKLEVSGWGDYAFNDIEGALPNSHAPSASNGRTTAAPKIGGYPIFHTQITDYKHDFEIVLGHHQNITITSVKDIVSVKIHQPTKQLFGHVEGFLGNYMGKMMARDGVTKLHNDINAMAQEWQVGEDEPMLFRYIRAPQYPDNCRLPNDMAAREAQRLGEGIGEETAKKACAHVKDDPPAFSACVYDVTATNNLDAAATYAEA